MKNITVFDNGGETLDRFTIIDHKTGEMIGASQRPFHPLGFGQHCGNPAWQYFSMTIGSGYMRRIEKQDPKHYAKIIRQKTKDIIEEFKREGNIGKMVDFSTLPPDVQQFAKQSFDLTPRP